MGGTLPFRAIPALMAARGTLDLAPVERPLIGEMLRLVPIALPPPDAVFRDLAMSCGFFDLSVFISKSWANGRGRPKPAAPIAISIYSKFTQLESNRPFRHECDGIG